MLPQKPAETYSLKPLIWPSSPQQDRKCEKTKRVLIE